MSGIRPGYVWTCVTVDAAGTCTESAWMPPASLLPALPTVEQAEVVGAAFFLSLFTVAAILRLLKPRKEILE